MSALAACGDGEPTAAAIDATAIDAAAIDAAIDAAVDAAPPPCVVTAAFDIGRVDRIEIDTAAVTTSAGWLFGYRIVEPNLGIVGAAWTLIDFAGQRVVAPIDLPDGPPVLAVNGDRALVGYTAADGARVQLITADGAAVGAAITVPTSASVADAVAGPGTGFRVLVRVATSAALGVSLAHLDRDGVVASLASVAVPVEALQRLHTSTALASGAVALAYDRTRGFDACFACAVGGVAALGLDDQLAATWAVPLFDHHSSAITSIAEIDGTLYTTWLSNAPGPHLPFRFGAVARVPDGPVLTLSESAVVLVAGGPRAGVIGVHTMGRAYLQTFDAGFTLGTACSVDVRPSKLLAVGDDAVLVIGDEGEARVVTLQP